MDPLNISDSPSARAPATATASQCGGSPINESSGPVETSAVSRIAEPSGAIPHQHQLASDFRDRRDATVFDRSSWIAHVSPSSKPSTSTASPGIYVDQRRGQIFSITPPKHGPAGAFQCRPPVTAADSIRVTRPASTHRKQEIQERRRGGFQTHVQTRQLESGISRQGGQKRTPPTTHNRLATTYNSTPRQSGRPAPSPRPSSPRLRRRNPAMHFRSDRANAPVRAPCALTAYNPANSTHVSPEALGTAVQSSRAACRHESSAVKIFRARFKAAPICVPSWPA